MFFGVINQILYVEYFPLSLDFFIAFCRCQKYFKSRCYQICFRNQTKNISDVCGSDFVQSALSVGEFAPTNEFARVAANGERIS